MTSHINKSFNILTIYTHVEIITGGFKTVYNVFKSHIHIYNAHVTDTSQDLILLTNTL